MEMCDRCGNQTVAGHSIALDGARRFWRLCCLCLGELVQFIETSAKVAPDGV